MTKTSGIRVLIVDDDAHVNAAYQRAFRSLRPAWQVTTASSGRRAMKLMEEGDFEVLITDIAMGGMDGIEVLRMAELTFPSTFRLVVSGIIDGRTLVDVNTLAHAHFVKPTTAQTLVERIEALIEAG